MFKIKYTKRETVIGTYFKCGDLRYKVIESTMYLGEKCYNLSLIDIGKKSGYIIKAFVRKDVFEERIKNDYYKIVQEYEVPYILQQEKISI